MLAGIALRDMELAEAEKQVAEGLKYDPRDLELLSMRAAARFLADDSAGFADAKQAVLEAEPALHHACSRSSAITRIGSTATTRSSR